MQQYSQQSQPTISLTTNDDVLDQLQFVLSICNRIPNFIRFEDRPNLDQFSRLMSILSCHKIINLTNSLVNDRGIVVATNYSFTEQVIQDAYELLQVKLNNSDLIDNSMIFSIIVVKPYTVVYRITELDLDNLASVWKTIGNE